MCHKSSNSQTPDHYDSAQQTHLVTDWQLRKTSLPDILRQQWNKQERPFFNFFLLRSQQKHTPSFVSLLAAVSRRGPQHPLRLQLSNINLQYCLFSLMAVYRLGQVETPRSRQWHDRPVTTDKLTSQSHHTNNHQYTVLLYSKPHTQGACV